MNSITNYSTRLVTGQFFELSTIVHIPIGAEDLGDEGRANYNPQLSKSKLYRARDLPNTDDALLYQNDPDPLIRYKHFLLGIQMLITIIRAVVASFICLEKWFKKIEITSIDTPFHIISHQASLLRWNIVGLIFPQFGRLHFGDEERQRHINKCTYRGLTLDLKENEHRVWRVHDYRYYAPCFQPVMRVNTIIGSEMTYPAYKIDGKLIPEHKRHVILKKTTYTWCFRTLITR